MSKKKSEVERLRAGLQAIVDKAPTVEPEEEDYHDMESAYNNGGDVVAWEAAQIARRALDEAA